MAELSELLDNVYKGLSDKIKELYDNKLDEHIRNISSDLSEYYTKDYGMIYINSIYLTSAKDYIYKIDKSRYIIHYFQIYKTSHSYAPNPSPHMFIFDNYGDCINIICYNNSQISPHYINPGKLSKYVLPNILIDLIKTFDSFQLHDKHKILQQIKLIAEDYYKTLTKLKYSPNKEYKDMETQTDEINETKLNPEFKAIIDNNTLTLLYYNLDELNLCDYLPKLTKQINKDGRLFEQIKELQLEIEKYKKQIESNKKDNDIINKKYTDMQTKMKSLLGI